jgi:EpsI family protein
MAAHWIGKEAADGFFHEFSGWIVFIFAFAMVFAIQKLISRFAPEPPAPKKPETPAPAAAGLRTSASSARAVAIRVGIVVAMLLVALPSVVRANRPEETPPGLAFSLFPMKLGEWDGIQRPPFDEKVLKVLGLDDYLSRLYVRPDRTPADLYVGYWRSQRQGDTMHSPQNCLPGAGWEPVSQGLLTIPDPRDSDGEPLSVNRFVIQKGVEKQLVLYWYQGRGRIVGSEYWSKIYLVLDAARFNRTDAAIVRVVVPFTGDAAGEAKAQQAAVSFVNELLPALTKFLPD